MTAFVNSHFDVLRLREFSLPPPPPPRKGVKILAAVIVKHVPQRGVKHVDSNCLLTSTDTESRLIDCQAIRTAVDNTDSDNLNSEKTSLLEHKAKLIDWSSCFVQGPFFKLSYSSRLSPVNAYVLQRRHQFFRYLPFVQVMLCNLNKKENKQQQSKGLENK